MSTSLITPTHVATLHRKPVGYHFCVGSRAGGREDRDTLSGPTSQNFLRQILPAFQSIAGLSPVSVIVTCLPRWRNWRTAIEHTPTRALAVRRLLLQGLAGSLNLPGYLCRWSFSTREQSGQESSRRVFQAFQFPPINLSFAAAHVLNSSNGVGACPTKEFPKQEKVFPRIA